MFIFVVVVLVMKKNNHETTIFNIYYGLCSYVFFSIYNYSSLSYRIDNSFAFLLLYCTRIILLSPYRHMYIYSTHLSIEIFTLDLTNTKTRTNRIYMYICNRIVCYFSIFPCYILYIYI